MGTANLILTGSPVYLNESYSKRTGSPIKKDSASGFLGFCSGADNIMKKDINMAPYEKNLEVQPRMSARRMDLEREYQERLEQERI